jgi:hypothetical protein
MIESKRRADGRGAEVRPQQAGATPCQTRPTSTADVWQTIWPCGGNAEGARQEDMRDADDVLTSIDMLRPCSLA